jgi:hypothetical protein
MHIYSHRSLQHPHGCLSPTYIHLPCFAQVSVTGFPLSAAHSTLAECHRCPGRSMLGSHGVGPRPTMRESCIWIIKLGCIRIEYLEIRVALDVPPTCNGSVHLREVNASYETCTLAEWSAFWNDTNHEIIRYWTPRDNIKRPSGSLWLNASQNY